MEEVMEDDDPKTEIRQLRTQLHEDQQRRQEAEERFAHVELERALVKIALQHVLLVLEAPETLGSNSSNSDLILAFKIATKIATKALGIEAPSPKLAP